MLEIKCTLPAHLAELGFEAFHINNLQNPWFEIEAKKNETALLHGYIDSEKYSSGILEAINLCLKEIFPYPVEISLQVENFEEKDWMENWKKHYKPIEIGDSLLIVPEWFSLQEIKTERKIIRILPGMAFGTGDHATTRMCLETLEEIISPKKKYFSLLDAGCGSGILSIGAVRLGIKEVIGIDNDPKALENAKINFDLNEVSIKLSDRFPLNKKFDIVIANIDSETLVQLRDDLLISLSKDRYLILSGISDEKSEKVLAHYTTHPLELISRKNLNGWNCFVFFKNQSL